MLFILNKNKYFPLSFKTLIGLDPNPGSPRPGGSRGGGGGSGGGPGNGYVIKKKQNVYISK